MMNRRNGSVEKSAAPAKSRGLGMPSDFRLMTSIYIIVVLASLLLSLTAEAAENPRQKMTDDFEPLPRDLEIQLALSALPPHLRDNAAVYVLRPDKGIERAREGNNGFHAFVMRTDETFRTSCIMPHMSRMRISAVKP